MLPKLEPSTLLETKPVISTRDKQKLKSPIVQQKQTQKIVIWEIKYLFTLWSFETVLEIYTEKTTASRFSLRKH
jgi:hypothetical protein